MTDDEIGGLVKRLHEDFSKQAEDKQPFTVIDRYKSERHQAATALESLLAERDQARAALEEIAKQKLPRELDRQDRDDADFEGGFAACVMVARTASQERKNT